jgi:hypothetical protein
MPLCSVFNYPGICPPGMAKGEIPFFMGTPIKQYFQFAPNYRLIVKIMNEYRDMQLFGI